MDLSNRDDLQEFLMSYIFFSAVFEGCWFFNGFSPIFALQRRGLMKGTAEQLQYIMRDEVMHCGFGIRTVSQLMQEEDIPPDPETLRLMWNEAEAAEQAYASYILRVPILGYRARSYRTISFYCQGNWGLKSRSLGHNARCPGWTNNPIFVKRKIFLKRG